MTKILDTFQLYDLKVEIVGNPRKFVCSHKVGDTFYVEGENLVFTRNHKISLYSLATLLPLLPAKQRMTHKNDWMTTDADIACPDPYCGARFRISRIKKQTFRHSQVTVVPLVKKKCV
jgi:uncharacterized repeat protein (TIGR04076 family)